MSKFLVLGAGLVAGPVIEYLSRRGGNQIVLASHIAAEAERFVCGRKNVRPVHLDVHDKAALDRLISRADLVISLVPPPLHPLVARACVQARTHFVSASYQTPEMLGLSAQAKAAGICILNEIGLDPGIDHLSAMQIIDDVQAKGEQVESFISWCGGLPAPAPAPAHNDNPLGYKFSWQPKGAILVLLNEAAYLRAGQKIIVEGKDLMDRAVPITISGLKLECYPNRNSVTYRDIYGIEEVQNLLRGTLRYRGFCQILALAKTLGLMNTDAGELPGPMSWRSYIEFLNPNMVLRDHQSAAWQGLDWLGCFSSRAITPNAVPIDVFCDLLLARLSYGSGETDMIVLLHKFVIKKPDGEKYFITSLLQDYGAPDGHSAMARTVGFPVAIAAQMIAGGDIKQRGTILPVSKEFYGPILSALQAENIIFHEQIFSPADISEPEFLSELAGKPRS